MEDCRNCKHYESCSCGKKGHDKGTSIGYSIGECKDFEVNMNLYIKCPYCGEQVSPYMIVTGRYYFRCTCGYHTSVLCQI